MPKKFVVFSVINIPVLRLGLWTKTKPIFHSITEDMWKIKEKEREVKDMGKREERHQQFKRY